jgi:hypothetical protein
MALSFPLLIEPLDVPFTIIPNVAFPDTTPVCVLTNLGEAPSLDTFIVTYPPPGPPPNPPEDPSPWQIEFRWQTTSPSTAGIWFLDAWLESLTEGPNLHVPGFPVLPLIVPGGSPQAYHETISINANAVAPPVPPPPLEPLIARLYRLNTMIRWAQLPLKRTRVVGRGIGPIMEFYTPLL